MADRKLITDQVLRAARPTHGQNETDIRDEKIPGFGIRIFRTGRVVFQLVYRSPVPASLPAAKRKIRRMVVGLYRVGAGESAPLNLMNLSTARKEALRLRAEIAKGADPQSPSKLKATERAPGESPTREKEIAIFGKEPVLPHTFGELALAYLREYAWAGLRRTRDIESILRLHLLPHWRDRVADGLRRRDVHEVVQSILQKGQLRLAKYVKTVVSMIYTWGMDREKVVGNPAAGLKIAGKLRAKSRTLSSEEIKAFWKDTEKRHPATRWLFRMILLTLQRPGEVARMEWAEISGNEWRIPGEKMKNGLPHLVILPALALEGIEELRPVTGSGRYVFESRKAPGKPMASLNKLCDGIWGRLKIKPFTPHDLRRTGATRLSELDVPDEVIDAIQAHLKQGVRKVYNVNQYRREKLRTAPIWDDYLRGLLAGPQQEP